MEHQRHEYLTTYSEYGCTFLLWMHKLMISRLIYLLSYYLSNKWSLHVRSQDLEILTLIEKIRKIKITHHYYYDKY